MIGLPEIAVLIFGLLIGSIVIYLYWTVADYGRNTSLGFGGALLLALFTSPIVAYFIILFFFPQHDDDDEGGEQYDY